MIFFQSSFLSFYVWVFFKFYLFILKFIYLFLAALGLCCCPRALSSCGERGAALRRGAWAPHCGGLSCRGAQALGKRASVVVARGLSSCGSRAPDRRLSSCGARAQLLRGTQDPPGPGPEPVSPALAGGLPTTAPPGKPPPFILNKSGASLNNSWGSTCLRMWSLSFTKPCSWPPWVHCNHGIHFNSISKLNLFSSLWTMFLGTAIPLQDIYPAELHAYVYQKNMFWDVHDALLLMSPNWKPPKCPAAGWRMDSGVFIPWKTVPQWEWINLNYTGEGWIAQTYSSVKKARHQSVHILWCYYINFKKQENWSTMLEVRTEVALGLVVQ